MFLQKATMVKDFAKEKQSDSVKIGLSKLVVYNVAIFLFYCSKYSYYINVINSRETRCY